MVETEKTHENNLGQGKHSQRPKKKETEVAYNHSNRSFGLISAKFERNKT